MKDPEYKKLRRLIIVSWALLLLIFVALALWGNNQIKTLKQQLAAQSVIIGPIGTQGFSGTVGQTGIQGPRGDSGIMGAQGMVGLQGSQGIQGPPGPQGDPGPQGNTGSAGPAVFIRQNPDTGVWECRFGTDTGWSPILECS